jgi:hypothetical protein
MEYSQPEVVVPQVAEQNYSGLQRDINAPRQSRLWERRWIWVVVLTIVIIAAVAGGCLGGIHRPRPPVPMYEAPHSNF